MLIVQINDTLCLTISAKIAFYKMLKRFLFFPSNQLSKGKRWITYCWKIFSWWSIARCKSDFKLRTILIKFFNFASSVLSSGLFASVVWRNLQERKLYVNKIGQFYIMYVSSLLKFLLPPWITSGDLKAQSISIIFQL